MYRKTYEITGYADDGFAVCVACATQKQRKECSPIFLGSESDCPGISCDVCFEIIETSLIHRKDCNCDNRN